MRCNNTPLIALQRLPRTPNIRNRLRQSQNKILLTSQSAEPLVYPNNRLHRQKSRFIFGYLQVTVFEKWRTLSKRCDAWSTTDNRKCGLNVSVTFREDENPGFTAAADSCPCTGDHTCTCPHEEESHQDPTGYKTCCLKNFSENGIHFCTFLNADRWYLVIHTWFHLPWFVCVLYCDNILRLMIMF